MTCCALMEWNREMASGVGLALPEAMQDRDAKSWFRRIEICAVANDWDDKKKLKCLLGYFWCPTWCKYWHLCTFEGSTPQLSQPWHRGRQIKCSWWTGMEKALWKPGECSWIDQRLLKWHLLAYQKPIIRLNCITTSLTCYQIRWPFK